jgi:hypothetical protein
MLGSRIVRNNRIESPRLSGPGTFINIEMCNDCMFCCKYLDVGEVDVESSTSELLDLLELAHMYAVPGLLNKCTEYLLNMISPESCVEIYERTFLFTELPISSIAFDELTA